MCITYVATLNNMFECVGIVDRLLNRYYCFLCLLVHLWLVAPIEYNVNMCTCSSIEIAIHQVKTVKQSIPLFNQSRNMHPLLHAERPRS